MHVCFAFDSKVRHFVVVRSAVGLDSRASSDMSNVVPQLYGKHVKFLSRLMTKKSVILFSELCVRHIYYALNGCVVRFDY